MAVDPPDRPRITGALITRRKLRWAEPLHFSGNRYRLT